jgi:hypothetical protein
MHTGSWFENLKGRDHFEDTGVGWMINVEMDLRKTG